jgi:putative acetyltransferase
VFNEMKWGDFMNEIAIRDERPEDIEAIRNVNDKAFGQPDEGLIVDRLRENCDDLVSLVALTSGQIVGHILFSPVVLDGPGGTIGGMGLGPMSVLPRYQRLGIGSMLVEAGLERLRERGCPFVIVLGHPEYYPRFGFEPASGYGIKSEWDVPDEAFMVLLTDPSQMGGQSGVAKYRPEFGEVF